MTRRLLQEHRELNALLDELEGALEPPVVDAIGNLLGVLRVRLETHRAKEDEILLPAVRRCCRVSPEALRAVEREHASEDAALDEAEAFLRVAAGGAEDAGPLLRACRSVVASFRDHFSKEEELIFPCAERDIPDAIKWELMVEMEESERLSHAG